VDDDGIQVGVQEGGSLQLTGGKRRLAPGRADTVQEPRSGTGRGQLAGRLGRDPALLGTRLGEYLGDGGVPGQRVSDHRCQRQLPHCP